MQRHTFRQFERSAAEKEAEQRAKAKNLEAELHCLRAQATEELRTLRNSADQNTRSLKFALASASETHKDELKAQAVRSLHRKLGPSRCHTSALQMRNENGQTQLEAKLLKTVRQLNDMRAKYV
jgi:hypothetical protein